MKQIQMIALRSFPWTDGQNYTRKKAGDEFFVDEGKVKSLENSGKAKRKAPPSSKKSFLKGTK